MLPVCVHVPEVCDAPAGAAKLVASATAKSPTTRSTPKLPEVLFRMRITSSAARSSRLRAGADAAALLRYPSLLRIEGADGFTSCELPGSALWRYDLSHRSVRTVLGFLELRVTDL